MDNMENMTAEEFDRLAATGRDVELKVNLARKPRFTLEYRVQTIDGFSSPGSAFMPDVRSNSEVVEPLANA